MSFRRSLALGALILTGMDSGRIALGSSPGRPMVWEFSQATGWGGWSPNASIRDVAFADAGVTFRTTGTDPQLTSPLFELPETTNAQWVKIDIDCDAPGSGELFYTNKTTGRYSGLEPRWMTRLSVPSAGRQVVCVWPFWGSLGKIIRLRFDPPDGTRCRLYSIRIVESQWGARPPSWTFEQSADSWQPMHAARLERGNGTLRVTALAPQAVIITPVEPFDAARRSILRLDADCPGEHLLGLYWVTREQVGLHGQPIELQGAARRDDEPVDLRQFPTWQGTITHLAVGFGTMGTERLTIRSISIDENDPQRPFLRAPYLGFERAINRPGRPADVRLVLEHAGGPALPAGEASLITDANATCHEPTINVPATPRGQQFVIRRTIIPRAAGTTTIALTVNDQTFTRSLRIDEQAETIERRGYEVPPPRPVKTKYRIGVYYFPGWSPDQIGRWNKQADFPERDPVLGWYKEGRPEVADWHVKWAVENGISFFIYDWYWRDGKERLGVGLNEGFLKARYSGQMEFALMWANHKPFADHTNEQLLAVTDYWIDHYFRRPNYLTIDGEKPYVSFFSPGELISCLGSKDKVRAALQAMRERVRAAGLPGLHVGACTGTNPHYIQTLKRAGFDSVTGYNYRRTGATTLQSPYRQFLLGHEAAWETIQRAGVLPYIPLLTVGWDSRPWHGPRAEARFARRTCDFAEALARLKANLDRTGSAMAILEAWNEWGEGSYIEPNVEFGFKDIEAIRAAFAEPGDWPVNIGPDDVGLAGKYDLRRDPKASAQEKDTSG